MRSKTAETIARAYGTFETQHGKGQPMSPAELRNRVDLTEDQISRGLTELALTSQGRPGDLGIGAGWIERM